MGLETTANAFAVVSVTSTSRQGQELCDSEVLKKYSGAARRTTLRLVVVPPYGSADDIEKAIMSCVSRMGEHASFLDRAVTVWDASHFLHSFSDCSSQVVPRLCDNLVNLVREHEAIDEECAQKFVQRARALLWLGRVIDHPDSDSSTVRVPVEQVSRRLRNTLLFVRYVKNMQAFCSPAYAPKKTNRLERKALGQMCQFVSAWRVRGWNGGDSGIEAVRGVRRWLEPYAGDGEGVLTWCAVCLTGGVEVPLVADGMDPGTVWCSSGHSFSRCVSTGVAVDGAVSMECSGCGARALAMKDGEFEWVEEQALCSLCKGGLVGEQCEAG